MSKTYSVAVALETEPSLERFFVVDAMGLGPIVVFALF